MEGEEELSLYRLEVQNINLNDKPLWILFKIDHSKKYNTFIYLSDFIYMQ